MHVAVAGGTGTVGRYVVEAARQRGHEATCLSRAAGVDLTSGAGLDSALAGVDVIIDCSNPDSLRRGPATRFFTEVTGRLHRAGGAGGARKLVALSIVGLDRAPGFGYYQAKLCHEAAVLAGPLPSSVLRATQFHEFPGQVMLRSRRGPVAPVPRMRVRSVAARTVGEALVALAEVDTVGTAPELAGPEVADLVQLARALVRRRGGRTRVVPVPVPGAAGRAMRSGALLPSPGARFEGPTFEAWLAGGDAQGRPV
jgi:uncharacterized protein YbjT (DUF2867 family)